MPKKICAETLCSICLNFIKLSKHFRIFCYLTGKIFGHFENGKNLVITASDNSDTNRYVDEMRVNGTVYTKNYLKHNELLQGGTIDFKMTDRPNMQRGTQESDLPYSFSKDEKVK